MKLRKSSNAGFETAYKLTHLSTSPRAVASFCLLRATTPASDIALEYVREPSCECLRLCAGECRGAAAGSGGVAEIKEHGFPGLGLYNSGAFDYMARWRDGNLLGRGREARECGFLLHHDAGLVRYLLEKRCLSDFASGRVLTSKLILEN